MDKKELKFPYGFYWGAATSAHQVEGGNHNDWSEWEYANCERLAAEAARRHAKTCTRIPDYILNPPAGGPNPLQPENYISGRACDHYNRYEQDFDIVKQLGHNAHRFSIEWSRVEPEEGKFNEEAIEHYRKVILALRARGVEPFVTLWHWTMPPWVRDKGGVEGKNFPCYFAFYAKYIVEKLKGEANIWITLNEPTSVIFNSYKRGAWPPQKKSFISAQRVFKNLAQAHKSAYAEIHKVQNNALVGFANILTFYEPASRFFLDKLSTVVAEYFGNKKFFRLTGDTHDFFAVQYYMHAKISFPSKSNIKGDNNSDMGWEIYPEGICHLLKDLKKYDKPIYITENGLADARDEKRAKFIKDHLLWINKAIQEGVDVRGYFYWSLLDNFEWDKGFWPRFGLVEVDYKTLERKIRPSAWEYAKICKNNSIFLTS